MKYDRAIRYSAAETDPRTPEIRATRTRHSALLTSERRSCRLTAPLTFMDTASEATR